MVPAKYPSKVKLEKISTTLESRVGKITRTSICEGFGVFIVV